MSYKSLGDILKQMHPLWKGRDLAKEPGVPSDTEPRWTCNICHDGGWIWRNVPVGHPDFGEAFRCKCQAETDKMRQFNHANLPLHATPKTFDFFEVTPRNQASVSEVVDYCKQGSTVRLLTLTGPYGIGKTHLLEAIGRKLLEAGKTVRYEVCADLLMNCRSGFKPNAPKDFDEWWNEYRRVEALLLDDVGGMDQPTPWGIGIIESIIDERYRNERHLVLATNLSVSKLQAAIGERAADRLFDERSGVSVVVRLEGQSYRRKRSG